MTATPPDDLVTLSNRLGDPALDYVILGEGNTSALMDDDAFWVKASGSHLRTCTPASFTRISLAKATAMLDRPSMTDEQILQSLIDAKIDRAPLPLPSVETVVHAVCLSMPGVKFVGHTHPTPINSLTCSNGFEALLTGRLFPDEVVVCGPRTVLVPYVDPGLPLAIEIRARLREFRDRTGLTPKTIMLQNHGVIALGATAKEVENITAMAVKAARIVLGTLAAHGPRFLPSEHIERIHTRADEHYRQRVIAGSGLSPNPTSPATPTPGSASPR